MSDPIRVLSSAELALLRTDQQFSKVRMLIVPQATVLACKCAETKADNDAVTTIAYNTVTSGSCTKVRNGMTCYVGSEAGSDDLGMVRVKACSGSSLTIARVSGITWDTDVHLTVVDDFGIWAKLPTLDLATIQMDDDIEYTNQNSYQSPTPVYGPDTAVPYSAGSYVYNAFNSYCLDGSSIINYQWSVYTGGDLVSGSLISCGSASSGSMAFTFPAPGNYTVDLAITSGNGKVTTGHRTLYVYQDSSLIYKPIDQIKLDSLRASRDEGGWVAEVTAFDNAGSSVRDRAKVFLISDDYYGGSGVSIGQVSGSEKVLMTGWISGESIRYNREYSTVKFNVSGANYWLKQVVGPSTFLESVVGEPSAWTSIQDMVMDDVIHHFLYWRSTALEIMDVYRSNNTRLIGGMSASIGSIWEQIYDTAITRMMTYIAVDRHGRFHAWIDPQVLPDASRTAIPLVQAITNDDITGDVDMKRNIVNPVSLLEVAGLSQSGSTVQMYMSRAPGSLIYNRFGQNDQNDRLVVSSQEDANIISGMLLAKKNNKYPSVNLELAQINHMLDIAPAMYVSFSVPVTSNIRQVSFTDLNLLIMEIDYRVESDGSVNVTLELEGETSGIPGYTVIMPQEPIYNFPEPTVPDPPSWDIVPPDYPDYPYPWIVPPPYVPPTSPLIGAVCRTGSAAYGPYCLSLTGEVTSTQTEGITIPYKAWLRNSTNANPSRYSIEGIWYRLTGALTTVPGTSFAGSAVAFTEATPTLTSDDWYTVEALDSSLNVVATGVHDEVTNLKIRTGTFDGAGGDIAYIRIRPTTSESLFNDMVYGADYTITEGKYWNSGTGECEGVGLTYSVSGSSTLTIQLLNGAIRAQYHAVSWSTNVLFPFNPGFDIGLYYDKSLGYKYFHVTGSSVTLPNQSVALPECTIRYLFFNTIIEGTNWGESMVANVNNYIVDRYLYAGLMNVGEMGFRVGWKTHVNYAGTRYVPAIHDSTYLIEQVPTYKISITDMCLSNICADTSVT